jgi:hypothetical protein
MGISLNDENIVVFKNVRDKNQFIYPVRNVNPEASDGL